MNDKHSEKSHQDLAVEFLAKESNVSIEDVARLYRSELARLAFGAHISLFLPIFAIRNVREVLRLRRTEKQTLASAGGAYHV